MSAAPPMVPQVIVVNQPPPTRQRRYDVIPGYKAKLSKQIGIVILVLATLSVTFGIIDGIIQGYRDSYHPYSCRYTNWASNVATGIWCGFFYFFSGGFAVGTGRQKTVCMIRSNLAFSIIAVLCAVNHLAFSSMAVAEDKEHHWNSEECEDLYYGVSQAMNILNILLAVAVFPLAITLSVLCGKHVKCQKSQTAASVMYNSPGQTVIVLGSPGYSQTIQTTHTVPGQPGPFHIVPVSAIPAPLHAHASTQPPAYEAIQNGGKF